MSTLLRVREVRAPRPSAISETAFAAARRGEGWALQQLYEGSARAVAAYLRAQGAREVEDLLNDVFLVAFNGLARFEGDATAFRSWLFAIAHNKAVDDLRRRARRPDLTPYGPEHAGETSSAEHDALDNLNQDHMYGLLAQLTDDQREVLLLRVVADLTVEQVAHRVGKPVGAVKALQRRGLRALQKIIVEEGVPL